MTIFNKCNGYVAVKEDLLLCKEEGIYYLMTKRHTIITYCKTHEYAYNILRCQPTYLALTKDQAHKYQVML